MKRQIWTLILAVGAVVLILVPTTFAVGEPGTTQYAQLGFSRFFNRIAAVEAQLHFLTDGSARLDVQIVGGAGRRFALRVYADGTCANPGRWIINRAPGAAAGGPFLELMGNSSGQFPVNALDLQRLREELAGNPNEVFALAIATVNPLTNANFRTCTAFRGTPFPPITTSTSSAASTSATSTATSTTTASTRRTTVTGTITSLSTGTLFSTGTSFSTGVSSTFGTTPVSTSTGVRTVALETVVTYFGFPVTVTTGSTTVSSLSTVFSTFTTGTTPFTVTRTFTTGTATVTTGTTFTTTTTLTL